MGIKATGRITCQIGKPSADVPSRLSDEAFSCQPSASRGSSRNKVSSAREATARSRTIASNWPRRATNTPSGVTTSGSCCLTGARTLSDEDRGCGRLGSDPIMIEPKKNAGERSWQLLIGVPVDGPRRLCASKPSPSEAALATGGSVLLICGKQDA
jgi:hypothetical protein